MTQIVEDFVPQQLCEGWGFFIDIEEGFGKTNAPTNAPTKPKHVPKPKPIFIPTSMNIPTYVPRETRYVTVKPDRHPSLTPEDMV
jgi:hypothetical protein